jgi:cardiolipin synthase
MDAELLSRIAAIAIPLIYVFGILSAIDAIMTTRTAQGATAWALALVLLPFISLPLYWAFGHIKFDEYVAALRTFDAEIQSRLENARTGALVDVIVKADDETDPRARGELRAFERLATVPTTGGNTVSLLVNGEATFNAIFAAIDAAETYVLAQFYIIKDDGVGRRFKERLIAAARRGVKVFLLYDDVGSHSLPRRYLKELDGAGVVVSQFSGSRSWLGRFRLNFRNHRKIVVTDGAHAFLGGLNIGDEYLGPDARIGGWRDTHLAVTGPAVLGLQYSFMRDWFYSRKEVPELRWEAKRSREDRHALVLASGPEDTLERCGLLFTHVIESAEWRVWIASPYFVPDGRVLGALQLAAFRGVDVRILMPRTSDSILFTLVPYAYLPDLERAGVKLFLYEPCFMHQKVMLVDDDYAAVGTANFDNRSFRLNFEVTCLVSDEGFCKEMESMLLADFANSTRLQESDLTGRSLQFRVRTQLTRLLSPVL